MGTLVAEVERKYDVAGGTAVLDAMETMTGTAGLLAFHTEASNSSTPSITTPRICG